MKQTLEKSDIDLKRDVLSELKYEPRVQVNDIGVEVHEGAVTLHGTTTTYGEKFDAVCATKRVLGVKSVADDIEVKLDDKKSTKDSDLAAAATQQISWCASIPPKSVTVTVHNGKVKLSGDVEWWYQSNVAENAVKNLTGVKMLTNEITIRPKVEPTDVEKEIQASFKRSAILDAGKIDIFTQGSKVTLKGTCRSYAEAEEAGRASWAAPGVCSVDNQIIVNGATFIE